MAAAARRSIRAGEESMSLRVQLLGGFSVTVDDRRVPDTAWRLRKAKTLIKLLALAPGHRLHREQVVEALWPGQPPRAAANNLHQVLHVARRRLDAEGSRRRRLVLEDDVLRLSPEDPLWVDVEAFRAEARAALRAGAPERALAAVPLYPGDLLPEDLYESWTEPARAELRSLRDELAALSGLEAPAGADLGAGAAAASARPAPAPGAPRDNLPVEFTTFVGREAQLADLGRQLRRGPLVTLVGPAGSGKTRLALEVAARRRGDFRDGAWLVELAPLARPALVADAVAAAVGVTLPRRATTRAALAERLAGRELLLVLDNCEHLVAAAALLAEALLRACPELQILATSREPLGLTGEIAWRTPSLTLPDPAGAAAPEDLLRYESVRLFADRAAAARPGFALSGANAADVARICHRLDGLPLAIELAAARVAALPPAEIAERLRASFGLLRQGRRTAVTRQQTLEAALDWSFRLLDPAEAALLGRLSVFAGGFGLDAVESICAGDGVARGDAGEALLRLVDKSLVVAEELEEDPRYRLLEMVRQHAGERLAEAGERETLRDRHARWYLDLAERIDGEGRSPRAHEAGLRRLDREQDNLRAALAWLLSDDPPAGLRLAGLLQDWWLLRGRLAEAREWFETAIEGAPEATPETARALLRATPFAARLGDMTSAAALAGRSLAIARELGLPGAAAEALQLLGLIGWLGGDVGRAREVLATAVEEARRARLALAEANATHTLAIVAAFQGDLAAGRSLMERTLELLERAPDDAEPGFLVASAALVPHAPGPGRAPSRLVAEDSQVMFRLVGPRAAAGYALVNLAVVVRLQGDLAAAEALLDDALTRLRRERDEAGIAQALAALGRLATIAGDGDRARAALGESLALRRRLGDVRAVGMTLSLLGELLAAEGDHDRARSLLERAKTMVDEVGDRPPGLFMLLALGHLELAAGRHAAARARLEEALAVSEEIGTPMLLGWIRALLAEVDLADGKSSRAARRLQTARLDFEETGERRGLERCDELERAVSAGVAPRPLSER